MSYQRPQCGCNIAYTPPVLNSDFCLYPAAVAAHAAMTLRYNTTLGLIADILKESAWHNEGALLRASRFLETL